MSTTTPRFSDTYNRVQRESGWGGGISAKIVRDSTFIGLSLKSRTTNTPPGSPANGDAHYLPVSPAPTGVWAGQGGKVAAYFTEKPEATAPTTGYTPAAGYMFYTPARGLRAVVQDEGDADVYYDGTVFTAISAPGVFNYKTAARMASLANLTLSGLQTVDDIVGAGDDRVLVKNQSVASENGLYLMKAGAWVRTTDTDTSAEVVSGMFVPVTLGTINAATSWLLTTNNPIVLGTTPLVFSAILDAEPFDVNPTPDTLVKRGPSGEIYVAGTSTIDNFYTGGNGTVATLFTAGEVACGNFSTAKIKMGLAPPDDRYGLNLQFNPTITSGVGRIVVLRGTATAAANGNVLTGLVIAPTLDINGKTGVVRRLLTLGTSTHFGNSGELGIGGDAAWPLDVTLGATAASAVAYGTRLQQTLTAAADNDVLTALYINPTFTDAGFTGVKHRAIKAVGRIESDAGELTSFLTQQIFS